MSDNSHATSIGLLLSGGVDSAVLLRQLLNGGQRVVPFYVRKGGVWQNEELAAVNQVVLRQKGVIACKMRMDLYIKDQVSRVSTPVLGLLRSATGCHVADSRTAF